MPRQAIAKWWVYIVRCADGTLYTGITTELSRRIAQHNAGTASRYTRTRLPVVLVFHVRAANRSDALRREAAIKTLSRVAKEVLIAEARGRVKTVDRARRKGPRSASRR